MGKRVLCCGTFDYLHPGHISFLQQARLLGTELYVVVGRDENVYRIKGRHPEQSEQERLTNLEKIEQVDDVRLGYPGGIANFLKVVADIQPDTIALGYDQKAPPGLHEAFPECEIVVLQPHFPEKYKSSLYRRNKSTTER
jgi:cytidyltransferase-like protein